MLHALFFAIKIGLLTVVAFWVAQHPGTIQIEWFDIQIKAHIGLFLLALFLIILVSLFLHRMLLAIGGLPKKWKAQSEQKKHAKGYQFLSQGLTAVAAGDAIQSTDKASKMRTLWPDDKGLSLLLEAQAARLRGEEDVAQSLFDKLLNNKDTAFMGLRGLLVNAMENGYTERAYELAQKAEKLYPKQVWVVQMLYDLSIQQKDWAQAEKTLNRAIKLNMIDTARKKSDQVAMCIAQGEAYKGQEDYRKAIKYLKKAHFLDPSFVPAAQRLAELYIEKERTKLVRPILIETWKKNPHPDLIPLWDAITPEKKNDGGNARLRWFEKLVALNPDSAEGQMATAQVAMDNELWGQAREYLKRAEEIEPSSKVYKLQAKLAEKMHLPEEANEFLLKAEQAPVNKVWSCRETGQVFERWVPITQPAGLFNTVIWGYPQSGTFLQAKALLPQNELMITAK